MGEAQLHGFAHSEFLPKDRLVLLRAPETGHRVMKRAYAGQALDLYREADDVADGVYLRI